MSEEKKNIEEPKNLSEYLDYFSDEMEKLTNEYIKIEKYQALVDNQIDTLANYSQQKGSQRYLIDQITNSVSISAQKQSIIKDMIGIKKQSLDYSKKDVEGDSGMDFTEALKKFESKILKANEKERSKKIEKIKESSEDIDAKIAESLKNSDDDSDEI